MPETPERQFRANAYPYLAGLAKPLGWRVPWRALGVRYAPTLRYRLEPADLKLLLAEVKRLKPDVVVINERLAPKQLAALKARVLYCPLGEDFPAHFAAFARSVDPAAPAALLDDPDLLEKIEPDFPRSVLNSAPWAASPLMRVVAGARCSYQTRAADNPFYRGLELPAAAMPCSFCGAPARDEGVRDPVAFAARHIEAAGRRRGAADAELRFELIGARLWRRLEEFVAELARRGVRGAELSFMPRIDEILEAREVIRRCLPALAERGLALRLYGAGVENFSPDENARLNKGITAAQVHEAAAFIAETRTRWPGAFRFPDGKLSMILFTPWTTTADLRVNIDHIERCPLICARAVLGSRLQLFPGRPVTRLAEHDGLLVKKRKDGFYNSGCIVSADQSEIPWRFARPEIGLLHELGRGLVQHYYGERRADGPQARALAAAAAAAEARSPKPLAAFRHAVETLERRPRTRSLPQLLKLMLQS